MLSQNYALYPHLTVLENIQFPLKMERVPKNERKERAMELARLVKIDKHVNKRPKELSGDVRLTGNFSEKVIAWVEEAKKFQADLLLLEETSFSFIEEPVKSSNEEKVEKYIQRLVCMKHGRNFLRKIIQGLHL